MLQTNKPQEFINALKMKNRNAFNEFYENYAPLFYGEIKNALYKETVSEDVLVNSMHNIWNSLSEFDSSKERLFTWANKIVRKDLMIKKTDLVLKELFSCQFSATYKEV